MLTTFFRSSSLNTLESFCQMKYFLIYTLGNQDASNLKAEMGTVVHAVMECLAVAKKKYQDTGEMKFTIEHPATGPVEIDINTWKKPYHLSNLEVDVINSSRINKSVYLWDCKVKYGQVYIGRELVDTLTSLCYAYYSSKSVHEWKPIDRKTIFNWVWIGLCYKDGMYDPRNLNIISPEQSFELPIERPWAKYSYDLPDGTTLDGRLAIKGTIDLITYDEEHEVVEIVDWKTGQRKDWGTGVVKNYAELKKDKQLMLYYYAARRLYPNAKAIVLTIFFIRDGGPFSISFDDEHIEQVENFLQEKFEYTKSCELPKMCDPTQKDIKCKLFCSFYKKQLDGTNFCKAIHERIKKQGLPQVLSDFMDVSKLGHYQQPGE